MEKYNFKLTFHSDIFVEVSNKGFLTFGYNLGYNYVSKFPFVPWLYELQMTGSNLFEKRKTIDKQHKLEADLEEILEGVLSLSKNFPLEKDYFNEKLSILEIERFYAGNNTTQYSWRLSNDNHLVLIKEDRGKGPEQIFNFFTAENRKFIFNYLDFMEKEKKLPFISHSINEIIRRLKNNP